MYWAIQLTGESKLKLLDILNDILPENIKQEILENNWKLYADHITIVHSSNPEWNLLDKILKPFEFQKVSFKVTKLGISENAIAFGVDIGTANDVSHITMYVKEGHKPVESNNIKNWYTIFNPVTYKGIIVCRE